MRGCSTGSGSPPTSIGSAPTNRRSSPIRAATCRRRRAAASQALADALWESWQQNVRPGAARGPARPLCRRSEPLHPGGRRRHGAGRARRRPGRPARRPDHLRPADGRACRHRSGETCRAAIAPSISTPGRADNPASDRSGQIGVLTVAGDDRRRQRRAGHRRGGDDRRQSASAACASGPERAGGADRFARRIDLRLRAHPPRRSRPSAPAASRWSISMGNVAASRRLLDRDRGRRDLRRAGDDHRLDRRVRHPAELRGHAAAKLGVGADGVRTTPLSGEPDILRGPSPQADQLLQTGVESTYRRFVALVARARRLTPRAGRTRSRQGRVWDGGSARQLGLVDRFGALDDAIAEAARRANLEGSAAQAVWLEPEPGFWADVFRGVARGRGRRRAGRATLRPAGPAAGGDDRASARRRAEPARRAGDPGALPGMPAGRAAALDRAGGSGVAGSAG